MKSANNWINGGETPPRCSTMSACVDSFNQDECHVEKTHARIENDADSYHQLGILAYQRNDYTAAERLICQAIRKNIDNPFYFNDLGAVYKACNKTRQAASCYRKAIALNSAYPEAYCNLAHTLKMLNDVNGAIENYRKAIDMDEGFFKAHFHLARIYHEQGAYAAALSSYEKAIAIRPDIAEPYHFAGMACHDAGDFEKAIHYYQKTAALSPERADVFNSMGTAWHGLKRFDHALMCFQNALDLQPKLDAAHVNRGNVNQEQGRYRRALRCYKNALRINPFNEVAFLNMGIAWMALNQPRRAFSCYHRAVQLNPRYAKASAYLVNRLYDDCAWRTLETFTRQLDSLTQRQIRSGQTPAETPFQSICRHADPAFNLSVAKSWSRRIAGENVSRNAPCCRKERERKMIKVGYLSNTFSNHPGAHLISGIFKLHDRSTFEIFCFSYGVNDGSVYRQRIERDCDQFIDIRSLGDRAAADLINSHQIDILIDLRGFTRDSRLSISAFRPAPVQVVYLGYPGTTGADFIDYIIADRTVIPETHADYFSENIVYMPHCYQANDNTQRISDRQFRRSDFGIPENAFVFCSFSTHYKIEPVIFDCWARILKRTPNSVLCLLEASGTTQRNLRDEWVRRGVDDARLLFLEKMPKDEHLARLQVLDLALDTRVCNGHTTTSDALWAGLPVVTLIGGHFASRVSASILEAIGLSELITVDIAEYEDLAVRIAERPDELNRLKTKLQANRLTTPLFDTARFTRNLERAYLEMMKVHGSGQSPRRIDVCEIDP